MWSRHFGVLLWCVTYCLRVVYFPDLAQLRRSKEEFLKAAAEKGIPEKEAEALFKDLDANGDGKVRRSRGTRGGEKRIRRAVSVPSTGVLGFFLSSADA